MSDIKISYELRPCILENINKKALFHCFSNDGNAIIELENGCCTTANPCVIRFINSKFKDYCFEE